MKSSQKSKWVMSSLSLAFIAATAAGANTAPDNTAVNDADKSVVAQPNAQQQGMNAPDTDVTAKIRQELMKDDSLSTYAHNVKIVTNAGKVSLVGPVRSAEEKAKVEAAAVRVAGAKAVHSQLTVTR